MNSTSAPCDNKPPRGGNAIVEKLANILLKISGWKIEGSLPDYPKMVIAVAPHTSNWDFFLGLAVLFSLRIKIKFLGKHSIFVPVVKQFLVAIGGIPVERSSAHGVVEQIVDKFAAEPKMILAVAPEGTRSPIFPWKTGFLAIAHKAKVPLLLIGFDFKQRRVVVGPTVHSQGNFEKDIETVYAFFKTLPAKYPENTLYEPPAAK
ncbi:1-acyl-sn-glycerol-3-phosphate acyltransferase [Glaciecola sp. SC05]|uniref:1-acyl-sn-glycerol-3-phosphate acyltransferase n=1 Tax=Glaciecola sp. SC05 TaxID=1987355 RepID=UPI003527B9F4